MSFLSSLWPFATKTVSEIDAAAQAEVSKLSAEYAAKTKAITQSAAVAKINSDASMAIAVANSAWSQHIKLIKADAEAKLKAASPTSILVQLGLTGSSQTGPSGPTGSSS